MTDHEKLECAREAAFALSMEGSTEAQSDWFRKWVQTEPPTTSQGALSCFVADRLWMLIRP